MNAPIQACAPRKTGRGAKRLHQRASAARVKPMVTSRHGRNHGFGRTIEHAIVIKGPISGFTRAVLSHYLHTLTGTGVVFSHNNGTSGSACELPFLVQLARQYPSTFAYVLSSPPPNLGRGFRNAQREACFHGVRVAIERWAPRWVMVHRPDAAFVPRRLRVWATGVELRRCGTALDGCELLPSRLCGVDLSPWLSYRQQASYSSIDLREPSTEYTPLTQEWCVLEASLGDPPPEGHVAELQP